MLRAFGSYLNFPTTVIELTEMEIANASLLDEGPVREAMARGSSSFSDQKKNKRQQFLRF